MRRTASRAGSRGDVTDGEADDRPAADVRPDGARPRDGRPLGGPFGDDAEDRSGAHGPDDVPDDGRTGPALRLLGWAVAVVVAVALVRALLVQSFVIPSASMEPTLEVGDRVVVSRFEPRFGDLRRGDVVVFDGRGVFEAPAPGPSSPLAALGAGIASALGAPVGQSDYVKRVVGLPGERVVCCDASGRVTVDGKPLDEPYLMPGDTPGDIPFDVVVPAGKLLVLGDHRSESGDTRAHLGDPGGGFVPVDKVVGRVVAVWWPSGRAGGVGRDPYPTAGAS